MVPLEKLEIEFELQTACGLEFFLYHAAIMKSNECHGKEEKMNLFLLNASPKNYGATQRIVDLIADEAAGHYEVEVTKCCLGDVDISYCKGCKTCYSSGICNIEDDMNRVISMMKKADAFVIVAPSYWGDIPGSFKAFIDRCTSHSISKSLSGNKTCLAIALREGQRTFECEHIIECISHWCGHMEIEVSGSAFYCGISNKEDLEKYVDDIKCYAKEWLDKINATKK